MIVRSTEALIIREPVGAVAFMAGGWAVPPNFTRSWGKMIAHAYENLLLPNQTLDIGDCPTSYHSAARNILSQTFMGDWLVMFDADHEFEPDILARMLGIIKKWNVDVLTAVYRFKVHPYLPNLFWWNEEKQTFVRVAEIDWKQPIQEIKCSGAGCLLVRRNVFNRIRAELKEEPFDIIGKFSEDFSFYRRCMTLGIKTYVAPQIYSTHLRVAPVLNEDYDPSSVETCAIDPLTGAQK